ncbi:MAG: hypothetical protein Q4A15_06965 [Prevotellaceae bacterium]|nr:hypothetical protein [Prevotellaceae bacterium]
MIYEEVLSRFKTFGKFCDDNDEWCDCDCEKCGDMERKIIEAIEKQIPKKPITDENKGWLIYRCPVCGKEVGRMFEALNHHCECGQEIDWE